MKFIRNELLLLFLIACVIAIGPASTPALETAQKCIVSGPDWRPYMKAVSLKIRRFWMPPFSNRKSHVEVSWKIHANGKISNLIIRKGELRRDENQAALNAVRAAAPFDPLPKGADKVCSIEYTFDYDGRSMPLGLSVEQAVEKYGTQSRLRLVPYFERANVAYPPKDATWIFLKREKELDIYARDKMGKLVRVLSYPIIGNSGTGGPKLEEGDLQIPEGFYKITQMRALTHLCLCLNYPNEFDKKNAITDRRTKLGGDIQIHGGSCSIGCLAMGNDCIEDLFVLAHDIGYKDIELAIAPCNLVSSKPEKGMKKQPKWVPGLYSELEKRIASFPQ